MRSGGRFNRGGFERQNDEEAFDERQDDLVRGLITIPQRVRAERADVLDQQADRGRIAALIRKDHR